MLKPKPRAKETGRAGTLGAAPGGRAQAVADLILEVARCFFRARALGKRAGLIANWGGGTFGFMRSLALLGPLTVPQIAASRPTSRQRMQRLANELAAEGLVEFVANPRHKRSRLLRLTARGEARYAKLTVRFLAIAAPLAPELDEADVRRATEIVRRLADAIKAGRDPA